LGRLSLVLACPIASGHQEGAGGLPNSQPWVFLMILLPAHCRNCQIQPGSWPTTLPFSPSLHYLFHPHQLPLGWFLIRKSYFLRGSSQSGHWLEGTLYWQAIFWTYTTLKSQSHLLTTSALVIDVFLAITGLQQS